MSPPTSTSSPSAPPPSEPRSLAESWRLALSSWVMSGVLHFVLMLVLVAIWTLRDKDPGGAANQPGRSGGIVLRTTQPEGERYDTQDTLAAENLAAQSNGNDSFAAAASTAAGASLDRWLPSTLEGLGDTGLGNDGIPNTNRFGEGISGRPIGKTNGQGARVPVFDLVGEGHKFVYVFDRSLSMGQDDRIRFARNELIASLKSLGSTHQFQIIFYNQEPHLFRPSGSRARLSFATDENKTAAAKFVKSITPSGATNHEKALMMAIDLRPDVIFFLTDAGDGLTGSQLERIRRHNRGTSINAIQFDQGPHDGRANFSERLAHQNGGSFSYVDVLKLGRGR